MLLVARGDPSLAAYRDEILFRQTVTRYANAWHHREPFWFFITNVIPWLWLPLTAMLPWLVPRWREAWRQRDLRIVLPLCWILLVVLFFSLSSGKRGVYVLPAVPALAFISAPYLAQVLQLRAAQRVLFVLAGILGALLAATTVYLMLVPAQRSSVLAVQAIDPLWPLLTASLGIGLICTWTRPARGALAFATCTAWLLLLVSFWITPLINDVRSGKSFMRQLEHRASPAAELGLFAFKEQYLLMTTRSVVHFGHARWQEREQEIADAAAWLVAGVNRQLVVNDWGRKRCFARAQAQPLGIANNETWFLVTADADPACVTHGNPEAAICYPSMPRCVRNQS